MDGRTDGQRDGQSDGWIDGQMDGRTDGQPDGWMDGWTDGWTDRWTDGWTDGRTHPLIEMRRRRLKFPVNCSGPTVPFIIFHCYIGIVTSYRLIIDFFVIEYHRGGNSIAELVQQALLLASLSVEQLHNGKKLYEIDA